MNASDLTDLILNLSDRIVRAVTTGADWEIWLQVEIALALEEKGITVTREVKYPSNFNWQLDFLVGVGLDLCAIELKVQSALGRALELWSGIDSDLTKLDNFNLQNMKINKWAVGVAHNKEGQEALEQITKMLPSMNRQCSYRASGTVGVIVVEIQ